MQTIYIKCILKGEKLNNLYINNKNGGLYVFKGRVMDCNNDSISNSVDALYQKYDGSMFYRRNESEFDNKFISIEMVCVQCPCNYLPFQRTVSKKDIIRIKEMLNNKIRVHDMDIDTQLKVMGTIMFKYKVSYDVDSPLFLVHEFSHHNIKEASYAVHMVIDGSLVAKITN